MTNQQILSKAILKAEITGKWELDDRKLIMMKHYRDNLFQFLFDGEGRADGNSGVIAYEEIIFSHDWAEAFWGKKLVTQQFYEMAPPNGKWTLIKEKNFTWQYHLQQMVLEKEPLKYLEKFL